MTEYEALANRISRVALSLPPLMGRFRDLNLFLGSDATEESVQTASEMIGSCRLEARGLKGEIVDIQGMLKQLIKEAPE